MKSSSSRDGSPPRRRNKDRKDAACVRNLVRGAQETMFLSESNMIYPMNDILHTISSVDHGEKVEEEHLQITDDDDDADDCSEKNHRLMLLPSPGSADEKETVATSETWTDQSNNGGGSKSSHHNKSTSDDRSYYSHTSHKNLNSTSQSITSSPSRFESQRPATATSGWTPRFDLYSLETSPSQDFDTCREVGANNGVDLGEEMKKLLMEYDSNDSVHLRMQEEEPSIGDSYRDEEEELGSSFEELYEKEEESLSQTDHAPSLTKLPEEGLHHDHARRAVLDSVLSSGSLQQNSRLPQRYRNDPRPPATNASALEKQQAYETFQSSLAGDNCVASEVKSAEILRLFSPEIMDTPCGGTHCTLAPRAEAPSPEVSTTPSSAVATPPSFMLQYLPRSTSLQNVETQLASEHRTILDRLDAEDKALTLGTEDGKNYNKTILDRLDAEDQTSAIEIEHEDNADDSTAYRFAVAKRSANDTPLSQDPPRTPVTAVPPSASRTTSRVGVRSLSPGFSRRKRKQSNVATTTSSTTSAVLPPKGRPSSAPRATPSALSEAVAKNEIAEEGSAQLHPQSHDRPPAAPPVVENKKKASRFRSLARSLSPRESRVAGSNTTSATEVERNRGDVEGASAISVPEQTSVSRRNKSPGESGATFVSTHAETSSESVNGGKSLSSTASTADTPNQSQRSSRASRAARRSISPAFFSRKGRNKADGRASPPRDEARAPLRTRPVFECTTVIGADGEIELVACAPAPGPDEEPVNRNKNSTRTTTSQQDNSTPEGKNDEDVPPTLHITDIGIEGEASIDTPALPPPPISAKCNRPISGCKTAASNYKPPASPKPKTQDILAATPPSPSNSAPILPKMSLSSPPSSSSKKGRSSSPLSQFFFGNKGKTNQSKQSTLQKETLATPPASPKPPTHASSSPQTTPVPRRSGRHGSPLAQFFFGNKDNKNKSTPPPSPKPPQITPPSPNTAAATLPPPPPPPSAPKQSKQDGNRTPSPLHSSPQQTPENDNKKFVSRKGALNDHNETIPATHNRGSSDTSVGVGGGASSVSSKSAASSHQFVENIVAATKEALSTAVSASSIPSSSRSLTPSSAKRDTSPSFLRFFSGGYSSDSRVDRNRSKSSTSTASKSNSKSKKRRHRSPGRRTEDTSSVAASEGVVSSASTAPFDEEEIDVGLKVIQPTHNKRTSPARVETQPHNSWATSSRSSDSIADTSALRSTGSSVGNQQSKGSLKSSLKKTHHSTATSVHEEKSKNGKSKKSKRWKPKGNKNKRKKKKKGKDNRKADDDDDDLLLKIVKSVSWGEDVVENNRRHSFEESDESDSSDDDDDDEDGNESSSSLSEAASQMVFQMADFVDYKFLQKQAVQVNSSQEDNNSDDDSVVSAPVDPVRNVQSFFEQDSISNKSEISVPNQPPIVVPRNMYSRRKVSSPIRKRGSTAMAQLLGVAFD